MKAFAIRISLLLFFIFAVFLSVSAQKSCVIADAETHTPLRDALIHTDNNHWARTDYRGYFTMKYHFDSAEVKKPGYVSAYIYLETLPDTMFLLPEARQIREVEVWGNQSKHMEDMMQGVGISKTDAALINAGTGNGGSFALPKLFGRKKRDAQHKKRAGKIIKELDRKPESEKDAIEEAYEQETGLKIKKK